MLALVAPGQGSQTPGALSAWCEDPTIRSFVDESSRELGLDLFRLGTSADAEEIKETANAQPLIVIAGLIGARALGVKASVVAGHSVGEITAASIAGVLSASSALSLVRRRGLEMARAAARTESGMSALLGGEREEVLAHLHSLGLVAANENGAGQIVAAGERGALEKLTQNPPTGSRVRALAVAGAFHTSYMESAIEPLRELASTLATKDSESSIISNRDGAIVTNGREVLDRIITQLSNPVRWDLCMTRLRTAGVTGVIEIPPAGTLVGLIKRAEPTIETFALKSPADLDAAREFAAAHR